MKVATEACSRCQQGGKCPGQGLCPVMGVVPVESVILLVEEPRLRVREQDAVAAAPAAA